MASGVKISQMGTASALDGTEVVPLIQNDLNKIATSQEIANLAFGYKVFTALLTQEGANNPVITVLQNSTGETFSAVRNDVGDYEITKSGGDFTNAKTVVFTGQTNSDCQKLTNYFSGSTTSSRIFLRTYQDITASTPFDDRMSFTPIEIRIYP